MRRILWPILAAWCSTPPASTPAFADEGMWTTDNFPAATVEREYGVDITPAWLQRIRLGTIRLSNCTASFVSDEGLILTNHHCVASCLAEHSTREASFIETGFLARRRDEELRCGTQVADVLVATEEVTTRVLDAIRDLDEQAANDTRKQTLTRLEQACEETARASGAPRKCEAVTLYDGGQYFLYKYQRYDDIRLVFAPEAGIAAFGGDPDNFQFPRWCLDVGVLRAYENGRPAATPNHLEIDFAGPQAGDLVFVSGHPGSTDRLLTVAQLLTIRAVDLPPALLRASELRGRYIQFATDSAEAERIVRDPLNGLENGIKVRRKLLDALLDEDLIAAKEREEAQLRMRIEADADLAREIGDPWAAIAAAERVQRQISLHYTFLEAGAGFNSRLFRYARTLLRGTTEREKPNSERLREYTDAALDRIEQRLAAATPVYPELETLTLSFSLARMREWLGPDDPIVRRILAAKSPDSLARALVGDSALGDPEARLRLWRGGATAVAASDDPMIRLAAAVDADARAIRQRYEDEVEAPVDLASERIARARFAVLGTDIYPDATFTLRINFGTVRGWVENGAAVEPFTRLSRLFERATGSSPFAIPESWLAAKDQLDLATRFNLATNNDIIGGNSGSPLVTADGRIVGLIFDGNIHSIAGRYWFDPTQNRAVAVDMAIVREALTKVYHAEELYEELGARR